MNQRILLRACTVFFSVLRPGFVAGSEISALIGTCWRRILLVAVAFLLSLVSTVGAQQPLHGLVVDDETGIPLSGVNIALRGSQRATTSNDEGRFSLVGLVLGTYELQATRIGYEALLREVVVGPETAPLMLRLTPAVLHLREVTVTPGAFRFMDDGATASQQLMSRADIETAPQFSDDIFRKIVRDNAARAFGLEAAS